MNRNANVLPAGYRLPDLFDGVKPLDVEHVVNEEGVEESTYRTLCKGGVYKNIPMSAMVDIAKEADQKAKRAAIEAAKPVESMPAEVPPETIEAPADAGEVK